MKKTNAVIKVTEVPEELKEVVEQFLELHANLPIQVVSVTDLLGFVLQGISLDAHIANDPEEMDFMRDRSMLFLSQNLQAFEYIKETYLS